MHLQAAFIGAMAIADLVKTTLGPKGMVSFSHKLDFAIISEFICTSNPRLAYEVTLAAACDCRTRSCKAWAGANR